MIGKYRLGRLIGGGGMAEVFEATSLGAEGFARPVAIKRMLPALSLDPAFGQMFVNEARLASLLHHENIVSVLDFDRDAEGRFFIAMELVRGVDLRKLAASGPLPWGVIAFLLGQILDGLGYAHELEANGRPLRIVHRDVSPHNVMVSWDGAVKLVDFGIAKALAATGASRSNTLKGKMAYMSPEQAHGLELDGRADVFAVGVMGYELITGQRLFPGQTEVEILARLLTQPIMWPRQWRPDVPADLEAVVMKMLERDRDARFVSAQAAEDALLATSVVDARAQIALREILRQRFPEAPRRRGESQPNFVPSPSGPLPVADATLTAPTSGGDPRAAMAAPTRTSQPVGTPLPAGGGAAPRTGMWIGVALVAAAAIIAVALIATRGGGGAAPVGSNLATSAAAIDAGAPPAELHDAAPAVVVIVVDAAPAIAAGGGGPPDAGAREAPGHHHHDAGVAAGLGPATHPDTHGAPTPPDAAPAPPPPPPPDAAPAAPPPVAPPDAAPPRPGTLSVHVSPWANVFVDGQSYGVTPVQRGLPAGEHELRLVNDELAKDETTTIVINPGRTTDIHRNWSE